jgi:integrase
MKTRIGKRRTGRLFRHGAGYAVAWTVNGKRFFRSLRTAGGQPITKLKDAETARAEVMAPFRAGDDAAVLANIAGKLAVATAEAARAEDETAPALRIVNAWDAYAAAQNRPDSGPRTLAGYEAQWERFAKWMREKRPDCPALRHVTPETAAEYAADLSANVGANTHNKHLFALSLVFRTLAEHPEARYTADPFAKVRRKVAVAVSRRELTVEELKRVCAAADGELRTLLAIGTYTGLRLGDAATLRWQETDLTRGAIIRVPRKTGRHNPKPVTAPIHPALAAVLAETPDGKRRGYVMPGFASMYLRDGSALTKRVQAHFAANGVQTTREGTGFTRLEKPGPRGKLWQHTGKRAVVEVGFHSLRHTFVSLCRQSGAPLAVVEAIVGHASPAMTRHYTHIGEAAARASVAALPSVLGDDAAPVALPAPAGEAAALLAPDQLRAKVRELAAALTPANVEDTRRAMLAL